jgi:hypothetical protein
MELVAAITAARSEYVAGQAFAVNPHEGRHAGINFALHQRDVVQVVERRAVEVEAEDAEISRHVDDLDRLDQLFALPAIGDEVLDAANFQPMFAGELPEVRKARHRAITVHDFNEHAGFLQSSHSRKIDRRLSMPRAPEHTAGLGNQRADMAGFDYIFRPALRVGEYLDRFCAVGRADPGRNPARGVHRHGEMSLECLAIVGHHAFELEAPRDLDRDRHTKHSATLPRHKCHLFRGDLLGRTDQIPFVLPRLIVGHNHKFARPNVGEHLRHRAEN